MRHRTRTRALGALALVTLGLAFTQAAEAGTIAVTRDTAKYSGTPGGFGGGEMGATSFTGTGGTTLVAMGPGVSVGGNVFQTFCVDTTTSISTGVNYNWTVSTAASPGGFSGGNPDPLDARTAFLVDAFWHGTLTGYNYAQGGGRVSSATSLQLAIWQLEGEIQPGALTTAYNGNAQAQAWVAAANAAVTGGSWSGLGDVRVLNLTTDAGQPGQSLIVEVVTVTPVPLPSAALMGLGLMAGLTGVGVLRRNKRRALA